MKLLRMHTTSDIAWLAGIVDGEGCFSVKNPVRKGNGRACHQVWLVICNTSLPMMNRCRAIIESLLGKKVSMRKVWKGKKATRWQYWISLGHKQDLLTVTETILPHLTAKRVEGEVIAWFMRRACRAKAYKRNALDVAVLESLSAVKRNGGEAPAEYMELLSEVIPSEALVGAVYETAGTRERVETRNLSPNDNGSHERPALH